MWASTIQMAFGLPPECPIVNNFTSMHLIGLVIALTFMSNSAHLVLYTATKIYAWFWLWIFGLHYCDWVVNGVFGL